MFNVYLDGVLQAQEDIRNISEQFSVSIVREDGFDNTEQILRDKSESTLEFQGAAYEYICSKRRTGLCDLILCSIEFVCTDGTTDVIFEGYIAQNNVELMPGKCLGKVTALKDNSFSGLLRDYIGTEVYLFSSRTKGCEPLDIVDRNITMYNDPANLADTSVRKAFDCFDVLNYIVRFYTDNAISVVSDFLTGSTRYAITTGFNLYSSSGPNNKIYPKLTFEKLFDELRKKLRLYMVIEYDENNIPYLRIEQEDYSYDGEELLSITGIPVNSIEKVDYNRLFNSINVGSNTTDLESGTEYYPQDNLTAWQSEVYNSCSNCSADKNSQGVVLDLLSDYIIDSNMIYEALNASAGYSHEDDIYMFEYSVDAATNVSSAILTSAGGTQIYNSGFINETVINNWLGYTPMCVNLNNNTVNYFLARATDYSIAVIATGTAPTNIITGYLRFHEEVIDNNNNYVYPHAMVGGPASQFTAPTSGSYKFQVGIDIFISSLDCLDPNDYSGHQIFFTRYDSGGTQIEDFFQPMVEFRNGSASNNLTWESPLIYMDATDFVVPRIRMTLSANCGSPGSIHLYNGYFQLSGDITGCDTIDNTQDVKPYILEFEYPISHSQYMTIKNNKRGIIRVNEYDYYIKELRYVPQKISQFKLIGSESICNACS